MFKNIPFKNYYLAALIIAILSAVLTLVLKNFLPPVVPLFYGKPEGEEQLSQTFGLLIIPGISMVVTILNFFISKLSKANCYMHSPKQNI